MSIVDDLERRFSQLETARSPYDPIWREISNFIAPQVSDKANGGNQHTGGMEARQKSKYIYDSSPTLFPEQLTAGIISMTMPESMQWHNLTDKDVFKMESSKAEKKFYDDFTKLLFKIRYANGSGFTYSNWASVYSATTNGTGLFYIEESFKTIQAPITYSPLDIQSCYLAQDAQGKINTNYIKRMFTARQLVEKFGKNVSEPIKRAYENEADRDKQFTIIHAVEPRQERGTSGTLKDAEYASFYIDLDNKHLMSERGYSAFPFVIDHWFKNTDDPYGISPAMKMLADVKSLNALAMQTMDATNRYVKPAWATPAEGMTKQLNLNPDQINSGALDKQGNLLIRPITSVQNPAFGENLMDSRRKSIAEGMYQHLFQVLTDTGQQTATEVLMRNQEKADLLAPVVSSIQAARGDMIEREIEIVMRKEGVENFLEVPQELDGADIGARFTSPFDKMRQSREGVGIQQTLEFAMAAAQINPKVVAKIDLDKSLEIMHDLSGAPQAMMKDEETVKGEQEHMQKEMEMQKTLEVAGKAAGIAKDAAPLVGAAE